MIAYVSAAFGDWKPARDVQEVLLGLGYDITDDWTYAAEDDMNRVMEHKNQLSDELQRKIAEEHVKASVECHLHVLVCGPNFDACFGGIGEFFIAQYEGATCHVIAPPRNSVFFHLPRVQVFESFEHWRAWIMHATPMPS